MTNAREIRDLLVRCRSVLQTAASDGTRDVTEFREARQRVIRNRLAEINRALDDMEAEL